MYILKTSCLNFFLFFGLLPNLTLVLYRKPPSLLKTCLTGSSCVWQYLSTLVCPMICMRTQAGKHVGFLSSLLGGCCLQCSGILIKGNSCIHNLPLFKKLYSLCMHLQGDITGFKTHLFFSFHVQTITYETCCFYTHFIWKIYAPCVLHQKNPSDILRSGSLFRILSGCYDPSFSLCDRAARVEKMGYTWFGCKPTTGSIMQGMVVGRKFIPCETWQCGNSCPNSLCRFC